MTKKKPLTEPHKEAMASGRRSARIVETYLRQLEVRGRAKGQRSLADIARELEEVETDLAAAGIVERLPLFQRREDLQREALEIEPAEDGQLEQQFIAVAKQYGERRGYSYSTWREVGISREVLDAAGISRTRRPTFRDLSDPSLRVE